MPPTATGSERSRVRQPSRRGNRGDSLPQPFAVIRFGQSPRRSDSLPTGSRQTRHNRPPWRSRRSDGFAPVPIHRRALWRSCAPWQPFAVPPCIRIHEHCIRIHEHSPPTGSPSRARSAADGNRATAPTVPTGKPCRRSRQRGNADRFAPNAPQPPALAFPPFGRVRPRPDSPPRPVAFLCAVATGRQVRTGTGSGTVTGSDGNGQRFATMPPTVTGDRRTRSDGQAPTGSERSRVRAGDGSPPCRRR